MRPGATIITLALSALVTTARAAEGPGLPIFTLGNEKRLVWDDALMETKDGIAFRMHRPHRTGERCLVADRPWESWQLGGGHSLLHEGDRFRLWYMVTHGVRNGEEYAVAYAESKDGIRWTKPDLGLVEYDGSTKNNLVLPFNSVVGQVFLDPNAPAESRYRMLAAIYPHKPGDPKRYLTLLTSPDGLRWSKPDRPILRSDKVALDTQSQAFWDRHRKSYVLYTRMGGRQVAHTESTDPLRFPEPMLAIRPDNPLLADYYQSGVTKYEEAAHAYFALIPVFFHPADRAGKPVGKDPLLTVNYRGNKIEAVAPDTLDLHLFTSNNSADWRRQGNEEPFLGLGPDGAFDSRSIYSGIGYARVGDELWLYYSGFDCTHSGCLDGPDPFNRRLGVISRATLRLDGFVSADAGPKGGTIVTRPLTFTGSRLELNVDCSAGGHLDAELQDADGKPIPGFTYDDCDRVYHNNVRKVVTWKGKADLAALADKPVRLRLTLRNCRLYALQFADGQAK